MKSDKQWRRVQAENAATGLYLVTLLRFLIVPACSTNTARSLRKTKLITLFFTIIFSIAIDAILAHRSVLVLNTVGMQTKM